MAGKTDFKYQNTFYGQVCRSVNKQIFNRDAKCKDITLYGVSTSTCFKCLSGLIFCFIQIADRLLR